MSIGQSHSLACGPLYARQSLRREGVSRHAPIRLNHSQLRLVDRDSERGGHYTGVRRPTHGLRNDWAVCFPSGAVDVHDSPRPRRAVYTPSRKPSRDAVGGNRPMRAMTGEAITACVLHKFEVVGDRSRTKWKE